MLHINGFRRRLYFVIAADKVKKLINEWQNEDNRLVVELKDKHVVIGSIGYFVDEDDDYSMDYDFNSAYGKMGYATEAGKKLLEHLFNTVNVKGIYGDCDILNVNSWKLLEKLGFKRIRQIDDESYKEDMEGNAIIISIYLYKIEKNDYSFKLYDI